MKTLRKTAHKPPGKRGAGRPRLYGQRISLRLGSDQPARIAATLGERESREAFIRAAIERELASRKNTRRRE